MSQGVEIVPIEIKKAHRTKSVSFNKFRAEYSPLESIRFSKENQD